DFDAAAALGDRKLLKHANRYHRFALAAADEALRDAGVRPDPASGSRWACVVGAGMMGGDFDELAALQRRFATNDVPALDAIAEDDAPFDALAFSRSQVNAGLALLVQRFGIRGEASSVHTACASGGQAVGAAARLVRRGEADFALAGGFDSMINPVGLG